VAGVEPGAAVRSAGRLADVGGRQVKLGLKTALAYLQANQDVVNDLNVFPVPDGDTGSNMYLTLRAAVEDAMGTGDDEPSAATVMAAAAHGSLMGARGNSGVILSQILRGFSNGVGGRTRLDGQGIASALDNAREVAYKAVMKPTEGTILTVIRESAAAAITAAGEEGADVRSVLEAAVTEAHAAVERTPELLAVLRDAGVVDAGGFGLAIILEGFARALQVQAEEGEPDVDMAPRRVNEPPVRRPGAPGEEHERQVAGVATGGRRRGAAAVAEKETGWGYCTEFLIHGPGLDAEALRDELGRLGESSLVVGDAELVRVHIHTEDPAGLISAAAMRGRLSKLKVEDMSAQHHEVLERAAAEEEAEGGIDTTSGNGAPAARKALGVVSVAPGNGFRDILLGLGADRVVEGGQSMNPSTQDLLEAVRECNAESVIVLPNNKNVILTAQQVDALAGSVEVRVVPSRSLPQGISAMLALDPEDGIDANWSRMCDALAGVTTVEITRAVRDTVANGKEIHTGDVLAIVDDEITQVGRDTTSVIEAAVAAAPSSPELITVYRGAGVDADEAGKLASVLSAGHPGVEVELHNGGQEHYPFILSLE
jgi:DAK2 domain fusion protein YloV